ncbi:MAG TPA: AI-2E family transporter [Gemmatimonadales bacterium]|nr:AI-2E family transporter [Gemmatimonadales bacterium]
MTSTAPRMPAGLLVGIVLFFLTAALRLGAGLLLPIAIAGMFTLLLDPAVRALRRLGLPTTLGAFLVVFGTVGALAGGGAMLARPASDWMVSAPAVLTKAQKKLRRMTRPIQETALQVEKATEASPQSGPPTVQVKAPGLLQRLQVSTTSLAVTSVTVVFLTYFLLAMLPRFRKKLADLIGDLAGTKDMESVITEIETQMSRYVLLNTVTRAGVSLAVWVLLAAAGLPGAIFWALLSFVLSFIPYAGALVATFLVGLAALVSFDDTGRILVVFLGSGLIHVIEGNFVTPHLMGRHLPLNPVAIFACLLYWGWVWGPVGALMAVPLTVMLQVLLLRSERLRPIAILLDN